MNKDEISRQKAHLKRAESDLREAEKDGYCTLQERIKMMINLIKSNIYILENPIT